MNFLEKHKKRLIEIGILFAIFFVAIFVFERYTNNSNDDMTADMDVASFPKISFSYTGYIINELVGYQHAMNIPDVRDTITPAVNGEVSINTYPFENSIARLSCRVYSLDGKQKLVEKTVEDPKKQEKVFLGDEEMLLTERVLEVVLLTEEEREIYFYTRVVQADDKNMLPCLNFIQSFHEGALAKKNKADISRSLEVGGQEEGATLQHVTIHSDYNHVSWGDLEPVVEGNEVWSIKEMNETSSSVELKYRVRCKGEENDADLYQVTEFFRVRFRLANLKTLLLDYDRTMNQIFDGQKKVLGEKGLNLGIRDANIEYLESKDGKIVTFVQAGELWQYRKEKNDLTLLFSFASTENTDERNMTSRFVIRPLQMDKKGNVIFAVYGYMNRGEHEGEVGVAIYEYDTGEKTVEEKTFISTNKSYDHASIELGKMVYYSTKQNLAYALVDGDFYEINVQKGRTKKLAEELKKGDYVTSEDGKQVAYANRKDENGIQRLRVRNLYNGNMFRVECEAEEILKPLGFINGDFVCGVAKISDRGKMTTGAEVVPMYKVQIQDKKGEIIKTYENEGVYILDTLFEENRITLYQANKEEDVYVSTKEDYITNNEEKNQKLLKMETYATELKQRQMRIVFPERVEEQNPKMIRAQLIIRSESGKVSFESQEEAVKYYVYGYGKLQAVYERAGDAILTADKYNGVVVNSRQEYIWERGNRNLKYTIPEEINVKGVRKALSDGKSAVEALSCVRTDEILDLTGCETEELMYIIYRNHPIVALMNSGKPVVLIGYTENTITYLDAKKGEEHTVTVEEFEKKTEKMGHTYIG